MAGTPTLGRPPYEGGLLWLVLPVIVPEGFYDTGVRMTHLGRPHAQFVRWPVAGYVGTMFHRGRRLDFAADVPTFDRGRE